MLFDAGAAQTLRVTEPNFLAQKERQELPIISDYNMAATRVYYVTRIPI
jgi:hypothetical protein